MHVPPVENPACAALPFDFAEEDVTWVASKLSGVVGALGAEAMELRNWIL